MTTRFITIEIGGYTLKKHLINEDGDTINWYLVDEDDCVTRLLTDYELEDLLFYLSRLRLQGNGVNHPVLSQSLYNGILSLHPPYFTDTAYKTVNGLLNLLFAPN